MPSGVYIHKKNRYFSEEHRKKISNALKGRSVSEERRKKMSEMNKGKPAWNKGQKGKFFHTAETKEKIRQASLGRKHPHKMPLSEEARKKIGLKNKGRKHTEATKQKIREFFTGKKRPGLTGGNNPMHTHPNAYKSKFGKTGYRKDLGLFLKSRWEANVMRVYKFLGYTIKYEPKSFRLSTGATYRPDFYVLELDIWIEVKGRWIADAYERFMLFKKEYPQIVIQVIDENKYKEIMNKFKNLIYMEV